MKVIAEGRCIVNAASIAGLTGRANSAPYVVSKQAVIGLTKSAAKEIGKRGGRANAIAP
jgi:NAD(P)-dependent dehydrogenase (short-subunit alcohol dehydrogenase family)